jgi:hypothetical protein
MGEKTRKATQMHEIYGNQELILFWLTSASRYKNQDAFFLRSKD